MLISCLDQTCLQCCVRYAVVDDTPTTLLAEGVSGSKLYSLDVEALGNGTGFLLDLKGDTR